MVKIVIDIIWRENMVEIITDTSCDLSLEQAKELGVTLVPMTITFGDRDFKDRYEMEADDFYRLLVSYDDLPVTSQINPYEFEKAFENTQRNGDTAVVITLSSELSGTCSNAELASRDYPHIYVVDSRTGSVAIQCLVRLACRLRDQGLDAETIAKKVRAAASRVKVLALVDTLEYLKKGGRISATAAVAGNVLSIKPVLTTRDGKIEVIGKARGSKNANNLIKKLANECGGINFDEPVVLAYSGTSRDLLDQYVSDNKELYEGHEDALIYSQIGSTIGTHSGPGAIIIGFFPKNK